jgi:hypothetical protein
LPGQDASRGVSGEDEGGKGEEAANMHFFGFCCCVGCNWFFI